MPFVTVTVRALIDSDALSPEDVDVAGSYGVFVRAGVDRRDMASVALDVFHKSIGIDCLDDFEITVLDAKKRPLWEPDGAESGEREHLGEFWGRQR